MKKSKGSRNKPSERPISGEEIFFNERVAALRESLRDASKWNKSIGKRQVSVRAGWAQWNHTRLCILADSLVQLTQFRMRVRRGEECTLDHYSMCATARSVIDCAAFVAYLCQKPSSQDDWEMRRLVIYLHDATSRYRYFKGVGDEAQSKGFKGHLEKFRGDLEANAAFQQLDENKRKRLLTGHDVFIEGLRGAARNFPWPPGHFDAAYSYLSNYTHGLPLSFFRWDEPDDGVSFMYPMPKQYAVGGFALGHAHDAINTATELLQGVFKRGEDVIGSL